MILVPLFLDSSSRSPEWNNPELLKYCPSIFPPWITLWFKQFNRVELYTKLMKYSTMFYVLLITVVFVLNTVIVCTVRPDWTTPNSSNILLKSLFLRLLSSSKSSATNSNSRNILLGSLFPQILSCSSSLAGCNPELMKYCPINLLLSITR